MNIEKLMNECRYYRGEADVPENINPDFIPFWLSEASAVDATLEGRETRLLNEYEKAGKPGSSTKVNPVILAALFAYFCKGAMSSPSDLIKPFETSFLPRYMAST